MILHMIRAKNVVARRVCEGVGLARERETTRADPSLRVAPPLRGGTEERNVALGRIGC